MPYTRRDEIGYNSPLEMKEEWDANSHSFMKAAINILFCFIATHARNKNTSVIRIKIQKKCI